MALKLRLFGVTGASFGAMKIVGWIYTLILLAVTVFVARRTLTREQEPLAWQTILILASLRSPFLPLYAVIPVLRLLILLAATFTPTLKTLFGVLLTWVILNIVVLEVLHSAPRLYFRGIATQRVCHISLETAETDRAAHNSRITECIIKLEFIWLRGPQFADPLCSSISTLATSGLRLCRRNGPLF
jgi:hypothetical protein